MHRHKKAMPKYKVTSSKLILHVVFAELSPTWPRFDPRKDAADGRKEGFNVFVQGQLDLSGVVGLPSHPMLHFDPDAQNVWSTRAHIPISVFTRVVFEGFPACFCLRVLTPEPARALGGSLNAIS